MFLIFLLILAIGLAYLLLKPNTIDAEAQFKVRVVAHSRGYLAHHLDLFTFYLVYPRFIHSEMMTHKDFSRSAASSRAIPVAKMLSQVWNNPAMPIHWGVNQKGMQASDCFTGFTRNFLRNLWQLCGRTVCVFVWVAMKVGLHKQVANRMLEPWQLMHVTLTTCKLANFYNLRIHKDAQPEIRWLATMMKRLTDCSKAVILQAGEWHLPWIEQVDRDLAYAYLVKTQSSPVVMSQLHSELLKKMSAARCARSSYANFDGDRSVEKDLDTYAKLVESKPVHASPCEHQATPDEQLEATVTVEGRFSRLMKIWVLESLHGNLTGYICHRNQITGHYKAD